MKNHILCKNGAGKLGHYYWHFLFGYLFPLVYWLNKDSLGILQKKFPARLKQRIYVESCGPFMDKVMHEVLDAMHPRFKILEDHEIKQFKAAVIDIPAWDEKIDKRELSLITQVAGQLCTLFSDCNCGCQHLADMRKIVLLDRAAAPRDMVADYKNEDYGRKSRRILNLPELKDDLIRRGLDVEIYKPGLHKLCCQINAFSSAKAIVGIRGAEFANLIWAKKGIPVILINPEVMMGEPIQKVLAESRKMKYFQINKREMIVELYHQDIAVIGDMLLNAIDDKILA